MSKIFGEATYKTTEHWSAQGALVSWSKQGTQSGDGTAYSGSANGSIIPLLMQQINLNYQRSTQSFYPLNQIQGKLKKCSITGAPKGTLTVQGIYAPNATGLADFLSSISDPCGLKEGQDVSFYIHPFAAACNNGTKTTAGYQDQSFTLTGVELESVGFQIQGGETSVCYMPLTFSFSAMELK